MKNFKGKAIYNPGGKAGEYSYWACNFYNGCSNGCTYCYLRKGVLSHAMGGDKPTLKKCFKDEEHALEVFKKELKANLSELQEHGLFFSFTTDPMLPETIDLTMRAVEICETFDVPVKILTKCALWIDDFLADYHYAKPRVVPSIAFGFTLAGHDELEPNASPNYERIEAMKKLHDEGFKTFASIEPIINFADSVDMISATIGYCDLYKIGLMSGKHYSQAVVREFISIAYSVIKLTKAKAYFKDSLLAQAGISRDRLPACCVGRDYNIFKA